MSNVFEGRTIIEGHDPVDPIIQGREIEAETSRKAFVKKLD